MVNKWFFFHFFFCNMAKEEAIKAKRTPVWLERPNHIIDYININMIKEFNIKARKSLPVAHHFVWNDILPFTSRKHTNPICGKFVSWYFLLNIYLNFSYLSSYPMIIVCNNSLHTPRSTQYLHQKNQGGTWGCGRQ